MIKCPFNQPAQLLPHTGKMVLLDSVLECIDNRVVALATIQKDCILLPQDTATHLPSYLAIEIMAQTVGAWAGAVALSQGEKVRIGFLLGTRRFEMPVAEIHVGTELRCEATLSWQDDMPEVSWYATEARSRLCENRRTQHHGPCTDAHQQTERMVRPSGTDGARTADRSPTADGNQLTTAISAGRRIGLSDLEPHVEHLVGR